jgi:imidazolonepropionase-like amidohydrolase
MDLSASTHVGFPFGQRELGKTGAPNRVIIVGAGIMRSLVSILCLFLPACAPQQSSTVAIRNVTVVDVRDGSVDRDQTVLLAGNRIAAVGAVQQVAVPDDVEIVEAAGRYLIPGLWDVHVHSVQKADWHFPLFVAHGVTIVRNMNDFTADPTLALIKSVRRRLAEGELVGPRLLANGPSLDGDPPLGTNPLVVRTAAEARTAVKQLVSNGADLVKIYENLSREAYFAIMDEARRGGIPVDGHVPFRITPEEAANAGQRTVEHPEALALGCSAAAEAERNRFESVLADYDSLPDAEKSPVVMFRHFRALYDSRDPASCASAIAAYLRNGMAVTTDLVAYHHVVYAEQILSDAARMRLVPQEIRRNWEDQLASEALREAQSILRPILPLELENVRLFNKAGVVLLAGTDVGVPLQVPGISLHVELERLVEAGLSPLEALQTATINPARVLNKADSLGTIEPGKLADMVLVDANPLEDIRNTQKIRAVVADGRLYRRADLDQLLTVAHTSNQK